MSTCRGSSDPLTKPWDKYNLRLYDWDLMAAVREFEHERLKSMADGEMTIEGLKETDSEGALGNDRERGRGRYALSPGSQPAQSRANCQFAQQMQRSRHR